MYATEEDELFSGLNDDLQFIEEESSNKKSPNWATHITWNSALDRPL